MLKRTVNTVRRGSSGSKVTITPSWFQTAFIPRLQSVSHAACTHPIHTIAFVAVLASTTYIALLESSLFEPPTPTHLSPGQVDIASFLGGSKTLRASQDTGWRWQNGDDNPAAAATLVGTASEPYRKESNMRSLRNMMHYLRSSFLTI